MLNPLNGHQITKKILNICINGKILTNLQPILHDTFTDNLFPVVLCGCYNVYETVKGQMIDV